MRSLSYIILFTFLSITLLAQELSNYRSTDWSKAGTNTLFQEGKSYYNLSHYGAFSDGEYPNDSIVGTILDGLNSSDTATLYFPAGAYMFHKTLNLPSNVRLLGEGNDSTLLLFDLETEGNAIQVTGGKRNTQYELLQDGAFHQNFLLCTPDSLLTPGDYIQVIDDDDDLVSSSWALHSTGQIIQIKAIVGDTLWLESELRRTFRKNKGAYIFELEPAKNVAIENLSIQRLDATTISTSTIFFNYAIHSYVKCVASYKCNFAHIKVNNSAFISIIGNHFQDAFEYGSGGKGYGVMLQSASSECLVSENSFNHLRHALILQAGANGNVISYNYSVNPYWSGTALPSNSSGDLVLHGNYPYLNLFEGNTVQNIVIDDSHGENGKFNTFFRNRAELYGIVMNFSTPSDSQNFIGNEIPNTGFFHGNYYLCGNGHYECGNNHKGTIKPSNSPTLTQASLYLASVPYFYNYHSSWPPIGPPNNIEEHQTETYLRVNQQGKLTQCAPDPTLNLPQPKKEEIKVFPNPCKDRIQVDDEGKGIMYLQLYDTKGKLIAHTTESELAMLHLPNGVYFLEIVGKSGVQTTKIIKE